MANRFFPVIEPILKKNNIRMISNTLCVPKVIFAWPLHQPAQKACGNLLILRQTKRLEINSEVDERYNVEKSTEAACKFIQYLKRSFWKLDTCSCCIQLGPALLAKRLEEQQVDNYYDLNSMRKPRGISSASLPSRKS
jgi:hypothetical protein